MSVLKAMKRENLFTSFIDVVNMYLVDSEDVETRRAILKIVDTDGLNPDSPNILYNYTSMLKGRLVKSGLLNEIKVFLTAHLDLIKNAMGVTVQPAVKTDIAVEPVIQDKLEENSVKHENVESGIINPDAVFYTFALNSKQAVFSASGRILPEEISNDIYLRGNPFKRGSAPNKLHTFLKDWRTFKDLMDFAAAEDIKDTAVNKFLKDYLLGEKLNEGCYIEFKNGYVRVIELNADDPDIQFLKNAKAEPAVTLNPS
jgi:hypothetical protein